MRIPALGGGHALVLCYHAVSRSWPAPLSVTPERFRSQITRLLRRGYEPMTFAAAAAASPNPKVLAVTFDDAYRSTIEKAAPILEALDVPATVFVPSAFIGTERPMAWPGIDRWLGTPHESELLPMSWAELEQLARAGWEIGSHTETHPRLTGIDDRALGRELSASRATCETRLGRACQSIAYPYGDVDDRVVSAAASAGYRFGAGLGGVTGASHPLLQARVGIYHGDPLWRYELKVARATRRLRDSASIGPLVAAALARCRRPSSTV